MRLVIKNLKNISKIAGKNATYTSPQIQNEIIDICGTAIKADLVRDIKKAYAYSILADESADISGKEQLSIGVRFFDVDKMIIREEFLGFIVLIAMDAHTIATAIHKFIVNEGLDENKCVGQGYDGCATMAGKVGGVAKLLKEKFHKALYFHCASHRLNLVINDLNAVQLIRNTIYTIKDIIRFFRESCLRRRYAPNLPMLCETRWSQKYKSIAVFKEHFEKIVEGLERLTEEGNDLTRKSAFQLHCAATKPSFLVCLVLIAEYSALIQPIANILQSKSLDLLQCMEHIKRILAVVADHRQKADDKFTNLFSTAEQMAHNIGVDLQLPRFVKRQNRLSDHPITTPAEYWKVSLFIPYLDSLKTSLEQRFSDENTPAFSIFLLHPSNMLTMGVDELISRARQFCSYYSLKGFEGEAELWYKLWKDKQMAKQMSIELSLCEVYKEAEVFFPTIKNALAISLAQPCTTATIERTFSTLRRVKTWLRSTMTESRLNGYILKSNSNYVLKLFSFRFMSFEHSQKFGARKKRRAGS